MIEESQVFQPPIPSAVKKNLQQRKDSMTGFHYEIDRRSREVFVGVGTVKVPVGSEAVVVVMILVGKDRVVVRLARV